MLQELRQFIEEKQLFTFQDKLLLAISGGIDSVVLFDVLLKSGYNFSVAHCNFGLRGNESDGDEQFVSDLAIKNRISFHTKRFDTKAFAHENAYSIQMAARELRYKWFDELIQTYDYQYVLTAHHVNDIIETMLFNLSRGTGIAGLHGIKEKSGRIVRPLLFTGRDTIRQYAEDNAIAWREDSSNIEEKYARNLIRHRVVPTLKQLNPKLESTFQTTADRLKGVEQFFKYWLDKVIAEAVTVNGDDRYISISTLEKYPETTTVLSEILLPLGFHYHTIKTITTTGNTTGKTWYGNGYKLTRNRDHWVLSPVMPKEKIDFQVFSIEGPIDLPHGDLTFQIIPKSLLAGISREKNIAQLDLSKVVFPLQIRTWQAGDKFIPLGMSQFKKLSDFFIDTKYPSHQKEEALVICTSNDISWIIGQRIDDRFKITDTTESVLIIEFIPRLTESQGIKDQNL